MSTPSRPSPAPPVLLALLAGGCGAAAGSPASADGGTPMSPDAATAPTPDAASAPFAAPPADAAGPDATSPTHACASALAALDELALRFPSSTERTRAETYYAGGCP